MSSPDRDSVRTISKSGSAWVAASGIIAGGVGLVATLLTARVLSLSDNSRFLVFWGALFAVFGLLNGVALEVTRAVTARRLSSGNDPGIRLSRVVVILVVVLLGVGAVTMPVWRHGLAGNSGPDLWWAAGALLAGIVGFAGHVTMTGALAGEGKWRLYSKTVIAESLTRITLMVLCAWMGWGAIGFMFATVLAEYAWIVVLVSARQARQALRAQSDVSGRRFFRRVIGAVLGQGGSALLVVGFPWLMGLTTPTDLLVAATPLSFAVILTRAPLMVPLNAFQGVAVAYFTAHRNQSLKTIVRVAGVIGMAGVLVAGLAWAIGPALLALVKPDYRIEGVVLAGLTMGATGIAILTMTGVLCQAATQYKGYVSGWLLAAALAVVLLLLPVPITTRVLLALLISPVLGITIHTLVLVTASRTVDDLPST